MSGGMKFKTRLAGGAAFAALMFGGVAAQAAEPVKFDIAPQPLTAALNEFGVQSNHAVLFTTDLTGAKVTHGVSKEADPEIALAEMLDGTGLSFRRSGDAFLIVSASDPQSGSAAGDGAEGTVQALVVTAQKREENIQDVPIAMSAFTQEDLTRSQVAGGPDLMTQVPNFTFTKTNFSGYSIQIRGIGTQAISATTDAAVAVAFNNTPFIRNRFFEQEFYDLQRVEVLRGPQGTLYGRNATAGVVNIISAKPTFHYEARLSADVGNYNSSRLEGMINLPLVDDKVAVRFAGARTKRDGYDTNQITGNRIDGRDLWSTRVSLRFEPTDNIHANLIWEHFNENDDRLRSGKQLCNTDEVTSVAGFPTTHYEGLPETGQGGTIFAGVQASFSQGCRPTSLYAPESFETPNGLSLPYYAPLGAVFLPVALDDPYVSRTQSHDLRVIESTVDPQYRAKTDLGELQLTFDLAHDLTLTSETGYLADNIFSMEDYNRFNTAPGAWRTTGGGAPELLARGILDQNGYFCDPQIGCANRLVAIDLSTAKSRQFSQELRLGSNFEGPFNFSLGANFLRYDTLEKYYVFINSLSLIAAISPNYWGPAPRPTYIPGITDNYECLDNGLTPPGFTTAQGVTKCTYMDPNPITSLNDQGHNYFLSKNPYKLISYAMFGEAYYNFAENLKLTAGLRWTVDRKEAPRIPSWVLADSSAGYPIAGVIRQEWREPTGRLAIDWKPHLSFTDETLIYGSYAHGYKAGGANPPAAGVTFYCSTCGNAIVAATGAIEQSATHPTTFKPEFVNAFELGAKNTFLDGRATLNLATFYYDYTGYQISQIVDRSAINYNFDAKVWGAEIEADWRPVENLRLAFKGGYEKTRVDDGEKAVDVMDRTAGNKDWVVVRPFPSLPSNCILPAWLFVGHDSITPQLVNLGGKGGGNVGGCELAYFSDFDPVTQAPYQLNPPPAFGHRPPINYAAWNSDLSHYPGWPTGVPLGTTYPGWDPSTAPNHGEGFYKDLSGKELPNAPHFTATVMADYTLPLPNDWLMTLHSDFYYQSEAWARIFNTPGYDKLKAYTNVNVAAIFSNEDAGWKVMAYVKNVFDKTNVTGAFLNSDDTGLTTNVFLNEPRLYGLRVTKEWTGEGWWTGANPNHPAGEPYPLTVELGGVVQRQDAPYKTLSPDFADAFSAAIDPRKAENRDLDRGDARSIRVTYRPGSGAWKISGGVQYGRASSATRMHQSELAVASCAAGYPIEFMCSPDYDYGILLQNIYNWSDAYVRSSEEHTAVDFSVGRDFGLGALAGNSSASLGLRYASFRSDTGATMSGIPDWNAPAEFLWLKYSHFDRYSGNVSAHREFKGAGPTLSFEAAMPLIGNERTGHVNLDSSVTGGVLFGRQKTAIAGSETAAYWRGKYRSPRVPLPSDVTPSTLAIAPRSKSVSVPLVDLSLGVSYDIQRVKVSTGYRWERYFNALDAGFDKRQQYDRTFDGPYFKIAVGFGG